MSSHIIDTPGRNRQSNAPREQVDPTETVTRKPGADARMSNAARTGKKEESAFMQEETAADACREWRTRPEGTRGARPDTLAANKDTAADK